MGTLERLATVVGKELVVGVGDGLLADAFEQIGYQRESPSVRNNFPAAIELRTGLPDVGFPRSTGPDVIRSVSARQFLDLLGIRLDPARAQGAGFTINLITPYRRAAYQMRPVWPALRVQRGLRCQWTCQLIGAGLLGNGRHDRYQPDGGGSN